MTKHRYLRLLAIFLAFVMLFTACTTPPPESSQPEELPGIGDETPYERRTIPYSEMAYQRPDVEALKQEIATQTENVKNAESYSDILEAYYAFDTSTFSTMYSLIRLKKYHDATDTYADKEYRFMVDAAVDVELLLNGFYKAIIESPFTEDYRTDVGDYVYETELIQIRLDGEAISQQKKARNQISVDYNEALSTLTVEYGGVTYTLSDIFSMDYNYNTYETYWGALDLYYDTHTDTYADMYAQFISLDKEIASILGFESAIEMNFLSLNRDYTPEEALAICQYVKEYLVPLYSDVSSPYTPPSPPKDISMDIIRDMLGEADSSFVECWDYMLENELYDIDPLPNKQAGIAFCTTLNDYDAPFIYHSWHDRFRSFTTMTHEFGHFYEKWSHYDQYIVHNLDLAEVYSQGLELILQSYYPEHLGDDIAQGAALSNLADLYQVFPYQCLLFEFEYRAYNLDTINADTLGRLYFDLLVEYGYGDYYAPGTVSDSEWIDVTHKINTPFYTISYVTSATAALQLWEQTQDEGPEAAVATYMKLLNAEQNAPFNEILVDVGLKPTTDSQVYEDMADAFYHIFVEGTDIIMDAA